MKKCSMRKRRQCLLRTVRDDRRDIEKALPLVESALKVMGHDLQRAP